MRRAFSIRSRNMMMVRDGKGWPGSGREGRRVDAIGQSYRDAVHPCRLFISSKGSLNSWSVCVCLCLCLCVCVLCVCVCVGGGGGGEE